MLLLLPLVRWACPCWIDLDSSLSQVKHVLAPLQAKKRKKEKKKHKQATQVLCCAIRSLLPMQR